MPMGVKKVGSLLLCATALLSKWAWAEGVFAPKFVTVAVGRDLPPLAICLARGAQGLIVRFRFLPTRFPMPSTPHF